MRDVITSHTVPVRGVRFKAVYCTSERLVCRWVRYERLHKTLKLNTLLTHRNSCAALGKRAKRLKHFCPTADGGQSKWETANSEALVLRTAQRHLKSTNSGSLQITTSFCLWLHFTSCSALTVSRVHTDTVKLHSRTLTPHIQMIREPALYTRPETNDSPSMLWSSDLRIANHLI